MTTPIVPTVTDELIAEYAERAGRLSAVTVLSDDLRVLLAERADLKRQLAAASVDAERYRWLRDKALTVKDVAPAILLVDDSCGPAVNATGWQSAISGADADVSVDAARNIAGGD